MSRIEKERANTKPDGSAAKSVARRRRTLFRPAVRGSHVVTEFQPDAIEVEHRIPSRVAYVTLYAVVALIAAAIAWASVSQVDMIVTAQGKLTTTYPNLVVQPLETSVIREIHVKPGDRVKRGDLLATLDPTFSQADLDQLRIRVAAFDATIARLHAELDRTEYIVKSPANADEVLQQKVFLQRKSAYDAQFQNYEAQIASARANLKTAQDEEAVLIQRLDNMQLIETMRSSLMAKEVGSRLNFLLSRDARLEVESSLSRVRGSIADNSHRLDKVRADQQVFAEEFRRTAYQELVETLSKREGAAEELKKAELRRQMIVLQAPADAVVLEIANRTVGSVVREAETLFVLVRRDVQLQAEVNVEGRDVGQLTVGQPARIKFEAFPFQKYGTGKGEVRVVSEDSFSPDPRAEGARRTPAPYYRVLVDLQDAHLRLPPERIQLIRGMAVTAEMKVGRRSVISYFLYPLLRGLDESIREY
ncbi:MULTISPECIES: HlyD family type I secretion periplasmic adaptor subunit [unclassified Bradyrhizobium]|uniref:HlyD family type I secretion periplasmic adaptor subunit n=1 Tax=unclassified Bradyrhizobium TaxID=2631580 RepID=UPI001FFB7F96|nr:MULTISPECIES: HlyD family type I secretion periplasmic adaptor subunit [unclassified Bradyrhizobium]MCK1712901.1 HlyD family type I secretion periplasmic adaptor subunit [Bradyrhizobium sp. 143]MCK1730775.1 HlyD family type I secretion periplasmic adaptor subunit [Bradyrhizobium sp. 142]